MVPADTNGKADDEPVLVIGGAGFIGSHVVDTLLERGHAVRVLDDLSTGRTQNLPIHDARLALVVGDILDFHTVREAMQGVRRCIHLAAQVAPERSLEDPYGSALWNVLGFINVLEAAHESRLQRFVFASSAAVYGSPADEAAVESQPPRPTSPYGVEKVVNEQYADLYRRCYGLRTLGLRYFQVYGPRQDPKSPYGGAISAIAERLLAGEAPVIEGDPLAACDFIHVRDAADATVAALESDLCGVCNIASGKRTDLLEVAEAMGEWLGVDAEPNLAPARPHALRCGVADVRALRRQLKFAARRPLRAGLAEFLPTPMPVARHDARPVAARLPVESPGPVGAAEAAARA